MPFVHRTPRALMWQDSICATKAYISQLQFDHDTTTTRLRRKIDMFIFFACVESRRMEAGARDTS